MREIKFRAWDKNKKQMINHLENIQFDFEGRPVCIKSQYDLEVKDGQNSGVYERLAFEIDLMQYIGLKDKNGKEIYCGDIFNLGDKNIKYVVEWHDCGFSGRQIENQSRVGLVYWNERIEVMGNIY